MVTRGDRHSGSQGGEPANQEYLAMAQRIVSRVDEKNQEAVSSVLSSKRAVETYSILRENGFSNRTTQKVMREGIQDMAQGKRISMAAYARAIAEELTEYENGINAIEGMYQEGILSEQAYKLAVGEIGEHEKKVNRSLSGLEGLAQAAMWLFMVTGLFFMAFAGSTITGAVVGSNEQISEIFLIGLYVFGIGVFLFNVLRRR